MKGPRARAGRLMVCPHCWGVNRAERLCGRCGADMTLLLQESGGLRLTAPVQSPVPMRAGARLTGVQRLIVLGFVAVLGFLAAAAAFVPPQARRPVPVAPPAGSP